MVKIRDLGGIPEGSDTLRKICRRGLVIKDFRLGEEAAYCRTLFIEREILFPVREWTFYGATPQTTSHATGFVACIARRGGPSGQKGEPCL